MTDDARYILAEQPAWAVETLRAVAGGEAGSAVVRQRLSGSITHAAVVNRLTRLWEAGLLARRQSPHAGGRHYLYTVSQKAGPLLEDRNHAD